MEKPIYYTLFKRLTLRVLLGYSKGDMTHRHFWAFEALRGRCLSQSCWWADAWLACQEQPVILPPTVGEGLWLLRNVQVVFWVISSRGFKTQSFQLTVEKDVFICARCDVDAGNTRNLKCCDLNLLLEQTANLFQHRFSKKQEKSEEWNQRKTPKGWVLAFWSLAFTKTLQLLQKSSQQMHFPPNSC